MTEGGKWREKGREWSWVWEFGGNRGEWLHRFGENGSVSREEEEEEEEEACIDSEWGPFESVWVVAVRCFAFVSVSLDNARSRSCAYTWILFSAMRIPRSSVLTPDDTEISALQCKWALLGPDLFRPISGGPRMNLKIILIGIRSSPSNLTAEIWVGVYCIQRFKPRQGLSSPSISKHPRGFIRVSKQALEHPRSHSLLQSQID